MFPRIASGSSEGRKGPDSSLEFLFSSDRLVQNVLEIRDERRLHYEVGPHKLLAGFLISVGTLSDKNDLFFFPG